MFHGTRVERPSASLILYILLSATERRKYVSEKVLSDNNMAYEYR